jgi:hypothetical protein
MAKKNIRLDESFSGKTLSGKPDLKIDLSKIRISSSGNVQPAAKPSPSQPPKKE